MGLVCTNPRSYYRPLIDSVWLPWWRPCRVESAVSRRPAAARWAISGSAGRRHSLWEREREGERGRERWRWVLWLLTIVSWTISPVRVHSCVPGAVELSAVTVPAAQKPNSRDSCRRWSWKYRDVLVLVQPVFLGFGLENVWLLGFCCMRCVRVVFVFLWQVVQFIHTYNLFWVKHNSFEKLISVYHHSYYDIYFRICNFIHSSYLTFMKTIQLVSNTKKRNADR